MVKMIDKTIVFISLLLITILLTGCLGWDGENGGEHAADSDGDGYPDDVDDFPNDSNFHEKSYDFDFQRGDERTITVDAFKGQGWGGMVESDWKLVVINANIVGPSNLTIEQSDNFSFNIYHEGLNKPLYDFRGWYIHERIPVTLENYGHWNFGVTNYNKDVDITVRYEVYKIR